MLHDVVKRNPWWVVVGSTLTLVVCNAPLVFYTVGIFIKPITDEFGWARSTLTMAAGLGTLAGAIAIPFIGRLMDRWGVRRVLIPSIAVFALSIASLALTPAVPLIFVCLYALVGLTGAPHGPLPYVKAVSGWFDRRRGIAIGIIMSGIGLGAAMIPPVTSMFIEVYGWRSAYVALAVLLLLVALPAVALLVREPTRISRGLAGAPDPEALPGVSVKEALTGSARFWILLVVVFLVATVVNGTIVNVVPLLTDSGITAIAAASMAGVIGLSTMAGRLLSGYLVDRFFAPWVASFFFLLPCAGLTFLMTDAEGPLILFGLISLGLASGCEVDVIGFLTTRYFGLRRFGELYGYLFATFAAGTAVGPVIASSIFDVYGSYEFALIGFTVALLAASMLVLTLGEYAYPVDKTAPVLAATAPTEVT